MAFHGLMLLRDEEDIVAQCLDHLLTWIDNLYILDLGSTDATWEIVQEYARRDKRVVPWYSKPIIFADRLRAMLFDQFRDRFSPGDWVVRADADEFYHVPPPRFVRERLRPLDTAVYLQWYFFRLTCGEVEAYESGAIDLAEDRKRPIADRRRFYKIADYGEPRMFRYRRGMQWPDFTSSPFNAGFVARERIPIRHYAHRDPVQMDRRFRLRANMMRLQAQAGDHWKLDDWRKEVVDEEGKSDSVKLRVGLAGINGADNSPLLHWAPGTELEEVPSYSHVLPFSRRLPQRLVHPLLLPVLDRRRPAFDKNYQPVYLSDEANARIYNFTGNALEAASA